MTRNRWRATRAISVFVAVLLAPSPASALTIGPGRDPGVAVDAAGTAYIAWNGPEDATNRASLEFCRLPRGAAKCDLRHQIATPGNSLTRDWVVVSGNRVVVVSYRYGGDVPGFAAVYAFISANRGASFDAGRVVGSAPFNEATAGPGNTLSGATSADSRGLVFQNVPLDGSAVPSNPFAPLSTTHPYEGTVGLIDARTPLTVFADASEAAQFRRYDGSGDLNDAANWTAAIDIGVASYPKLAGGRTGLFLLARAKTGDIFARRWTGSTFAPPVMLGLTSSPALALFEDAAGRLHAAFVHGDAQGLHLTHAVSDNGTAWRLGTVVTQTLATGGEIDRLRVATAPDHIGVVVWRAGTGTGEIRVAGVGPDAGATGALPVPKRGVTVGAQPVGPGVRVRIAGTRRFRALRKGELIRVGSEFDTRKGGVRLRSNADGRQAVQTGTFSGAVFIVRQPKSSPVTDLALSGSLAACRAATRPRAAVTAAKRRRKTVRRLFGNAKGRFRTRGHYGAATVRGTRWQTADLCDATRFSVTQGSITVRDFTRNRTVVVRAPGSYEAPAKR